MHSKTIAVTAASMLAGVGLAASFAPAAHAATPASTGTLQHLRRYRGGPAFTAAGRQQVAATHGDAVGSAGAVTLVDDYQIGLTSAQPVTETISQSGSALLSFTGVQPGDITEPQILPAGTYTVAAESDTSTVLADSTLTVTAGGDTSEVLFQGGGGSTPAELVGFADQVAATPTGQAVLSVRNTSSDAGPVDVYVNGAKKISDAAEGAVTDVAVAAGTYDIVIATADPLATAPTVGTTLATATATVTADTYSTVYAVDDDSSAGGTFHVGIDGSTDTSGYQLTASDGGVFDFGGYPFKGSTGSLTLNRPMVGGAESPDGDGYYLVASDGGVFSFGGAPFQGSTGAIELNSPIVGMATTRNDDGTVGYLLVAADGGVFAFNAHFYGSLGGKTLTAPVVGIAADPSTGGYVIAEADGSFTQFGPGITPTPTAPFQLNKPIVGIAETPDGQGAWLVASDGGVFNTGDAQFFGSTGNVALNEPIVGISSTFDGLGYDLIASDGGVFTYGDASFYGSTGALKLNKPVVGGIN